MKKTNFIFILIMIAVAIESNSQIKIKQNGNVGINNSNPSYRLDIKGDIRVKNYTGDELIFKEGLLYSPGGNSILGSEDDIWAELNVGYIYAIEMWSENYNVNYSDRRLKDNINKIGPTKSRLIRLNPVKYNFNHKTKTIHSNKSDEQIGFIAQEVKEIFPETVVEDKNGTLGIKYMEFIPILVKALQEQQAEIDDLKSRIEKLESAK